MAFYGSTPAYRAVLDLHGWGGLQDEFNRLSKAGEWARMGELVDDEMLGAFAVVAEPEDLAARLDGSLSATPSRGSPCRSPTAPIPTRWSAVIAGIQAI